MSPNISLQRKFVSPEIIFGAGCRHSVGTCAGNFGARKVRVVSDPGVVKAGWVADVLDDDVGPVRGYVLTPPEEADAGPRPP